MSEVSLQERLEAAVEDLNSAQTAADVAQILQREGVRGLRGAACDCPLSKLLFKRLNLADPDTVEVDGFDFAVHTRGESARTPMGNAAQRFITAFDTHRFEACAVPGSKCADSGCEECSGGGGSTEVTP